MSDAGQKKKRSAFRIIGIILLAVISVPLAAVLFLAVSPLTETGKNMTFGRSENWMSEIDDDIYINEIAIPGTHNSACQYVQLAYFTKCQSYDIYSQLKNGFRYLDIRLGTHDRDGETSLSLWHNFCECLNGVEPWSGTLYLDSVLEQCRRFLDENPTETIIFAAKSEREDDISELQELLYESIKANPDKWLLTQDIPTLGECRGRIVLFRRWGDDAWLEDEAGIDISWPDQGGNDDVTLSADEVYMDDYTVVVQDRYKYDTEDKWAAFVDGIEAAGKYADRYPDEKVIRLHFLSTNGTPAYGHPYKYAKVLNRKLLSLPAETFEKSWVILDFGEADAAHLIWTANFAG